MLSGATPAGRDYEIDFVDFSVFLHFAKRGLFVKSPAVNLSEKNKKTMIKEWLLLDDENR